MVLRGTCHGIVDETVLQPERTTDWVVTLWYVTKSGLISSPNFDRGTKLDGQEVYDSLVFIR